MPTTGSMTTVVDPTLATEDDMRARSSQSRVVGTLHLRGASSGPRVKWDEEVVDNEGMGKKKSKICCIYHKPREFDESSSSSDESSSSSSGNDSEPEVSGARPSRTYRVRRRRQHGRAHAHRDCGDDHTHAHELGDSGDDRNAYESMPSSKGKGRA